MRVGSRKPASPSVRKKEKGMATVHHRRPAGLPGKEKQAKKYTFAFAVEPLRKGYQRDDVSSRLPPTSPISRPSAKVPPMTVKTDHLSETGKRPLYLSPGQLRCVRPSMRFYLCRYGESAKSAVTPSDFTNILALFNASPRLFRLSFGTTEINQPV